MMKLIRGIKKDQSGASAAEYALIVAIIGGAIVIGATAFGGSLSTAFSNTGSAVVAKAPATFPAA